MRDLGRKAIAAESFGKPPALRVTQPTLSIVSPTSAGSGASSILMRRLYPTALMNWCWRRHLGRDAALSRRRPVASGQGGSRSARVRAGTCSA
jgi:hypothetical protein